MAGGWIFTLLIPLLLLAIGWSVLHTSGEGQPAVHTVTIDRSFEKAIEAVQQAAWDQGFRVLAVHDMKATLRARGILRDPYTIIEVCRGDLVDRMLVADVRAGTIMPCRIAVFEDAGAVFVSYLLPSRAAALLSTSPDLLITAEQLDCLLNAVVSRASTP